MDSRERAAFAAYNRVYDRLAQYKTVASRKGNQ